MLSSIAGLVIAITGVVAGILALLSDELKKNKNLKYILVGVLIALSVYAMLGSLFSLSNTPNSKSELELEKQRLDIPIAIDSTKDWQKTWISVNKGDTISIQVVSGKWTTGRSTLSVDEKEYLPLTLKNLEIFKNFQYEQNGQGYDRTCNKDNVNNCPVPDAFWGALVARINYGIPFLVGNRNVVVAPSDGVIYLGINDDPNTLSENFGILAVVIDVIK
ncbi:MAG: hypothetical protein HY867_01745 [Chloroflexi bacterium]|nr:hypothetical protein [Chloroflexota bacterium]